LPATTTVLAFDFGLRHIGVAFGQSVTRTASPVATLAARRGEPRWEDVDALVRQWRPTTLLVGLPLNMDSTTSEMAENARAFADALADRYRLPVHLVDERLTSFEARGLSPDEEERHAVAARLIAESWLSGGS
jgi:putative Holliday junction resolvase